MSICKSLRFTTKDRDQGTAAGGNCATLYKGGWWYSECHSANPNGLYLGGATDQYATGITWSSFRTQYYSMKKMEIKIRKSND